ncbi:MAG: hypothetical protein Q9173_005034 [Seirophora scorigena]
MENFLGSVNLDTSIGAEFPALPPPPGVSPNFTNPRSQGDTYTGVATTIIFAMILLFSADLIHGGAEVSAGYVGIHQWNVPLTYVLGDRWLVPVYLGVVIVLPAMIFTKLTFFLVYLQVFKPFRWLRICVYVGATLTTMFYFGVMIYLLVSITPREGQTFMDVALSPAQFASLRTSVPIAGVGLGTDLYLLILPITAVMQLQLPTRRKIGIILIFLTGLAACIASAFSIYYRVLLNRNADYTWNLLPVNICTYASVPPVYIPRAVAEMGIGLCCVSMPALSKMITHHLPAYRRLRSRLSSRYAAVARSTVVDTSHPSLKRQQSLGLLRVLKLSGSSKSSEDSGSYSGLEGNNEEVRQQTGAPRVGVLPYELGRTQTTIRTLIGTGDGTRTQTGGIHVAVNMQ